MVLELLMASANILFEAGPTSKPIYPSEIPYSLVTIEIFASLLNLSAYTKSTGNINSTLYYFAN